MNPEDPTYYGGLKNYRLRAYEDMEQAHKSYVKTVKRFMDIDKELDMPNVSYKKRSLP